MTLRCPVPKHVLDDLLWQNPVAARLVATDDDEVGAAGRARNAVCVRLLEALEIWLNRPVLLGAGALELGGLDQRLVWVLVDQAVADRRLARAVCASDVDDHGSSRNQSANAVLFNECGLMIVACSQACNPVHPFRLRSTSAAASTERLRPSMQCTSTTSLSASRASTSDTITRRSSSGGIPTRLSGIG